MAITESKPITNNAKRQFSGIGNSGVRVPIPHNRH